MRHHVGILDDGESSIYVVEIADDIPNGLGSFLLPSGTKYTGNFKDGMMEGPCKIAYADGNFTICRCRENEPFGPGITYMGNGEGIEGIFMNGEFVPKMSDTQSGEVREQSYFEADYEKDDYSVEEAPGYIYALLNSSFNGLVKIDRTTRDLDSRVKELSSSTDVPTPFLVGHSALVRDCVQAEKLLHILLEDKGYRLSKNKEFFDAPLKSIINLMDEVQLRVGSIENLPTNSHSSNNYEYEDNVDTVDIRIMEIENEAEDYVLGINGKLTNYNKAIELYLKSAEMSSSSAYWGLANVYSSLRMDLDHDDTINGKNILKKKYTIF